MASTSTPENLWPKYASKLAGGWRCVAYHMYDSDDPATRKLIAKPHGDEPLGRVLISPNGYLSAHIARKARLGPLPSGKQWQVGEDKEVAHVARGLSMYCGYMCLYEDDKGLYWQTSVDIASDPARSGGIEERRVRLFEDAEGKPVLELSPRQDMLTDVSAIFVRWTVFLCTNMSRRLTPHRMASRQGLCCVGRGLSEQVLIVNAPSERTPRAVIWHQQPRYRPPRIRTCQLIAVNEAGVRGVEDPPQCWPAVAPALVLCAAFEFPQKDAVFGELFSQTQ